MTILDERLISGLKALERLQPALRERLRWRGLSSLRDSEDFEADNLGTEGLLSEDNPFEYETWPPSLEMVVDANDTLPPYSAILGVCEDGLPSLLDLHNPAPGSLLIVGDQESGKTRLLQAILASATYLNPSEDVVFELIASKTAEYDPLSQSEHCHRLLPTGAVSTRDLIAEMASISEERRRSTPSDPAIILGIDDLPACVQSLDEDAFLHFYRLVKHGPRSRIWPIAVLSAQDIERMDQRLYTAFRTRIIGHISNHRLTRKISGAANLDGRILHKGGQFYAPYGEEWLPFLLCERRTPFEVA